MLRNKTRAKHLSMLTVPNMIGLLFSCFDYTVVALKCELVAFRSRERAVAQHHLFGFHAVEALLVVNAALVEKVCVFDQRNDQRLSALIDKARAHDIKVEKVSRKQLDILSAGANHQGVVAQCSALPEYDEEDLPALMPTEGASLLLILDGVQDPHNLGACLRTANAMGVHAVVAPKDRAAKLTPTAIKTSAGAAFATPLVAVTNLSRTLRDLKQQGVWLIGADASATLSSSQVDMQGSIGLVLGNEAAGMRRLTRELCDYLVSIPMYGSVSSLNVSVATGMLLYEARRQRGPLLANYD